MRIERLVLDDFRNIERAELVPNPRFTVLEGPNGAGKSNVLEAIYVLGNVRSFREGKNRDLVRLGTHRAHVAAELDRRGNRVDLDLEIEQGRKRFTVNGTGVSSFADYLGTLLVVVFSPNDLQLLRGGAADRRRFLDRLVCGAQPAHLADLQDYESTLRARNQLLKEPRQDRTLLEIYTQQLIPVASRITARRLRMVERMRDDVAQVFAHVFAPERQLRIDYRCHWHDGADPPPADTDDLATRLGEAIAASQRDEVRSGFTLVGPQRDDLAVSLDQVPVREYASQGQMRTAVLALKITEIRILHESHGDAPVLLLDDVSSELDRQRNAQLFDLIARIDAQTLITTTDRRFIQIASDVTSVTIDHGVLQ